MYNCVISKLENVRRIDGSDFIQSAQVNGFTVVVGLDAKENDIVAYFDSDGQIAHEICFNNDLYSKPELNLDKEKRGYIEASRRIKCQRLRGIKSEGLVLPLSVFNYTGYDISKFKVGDMFNELNGHHICNKYFTEKTLARIQNNKSNSVNYVKKDIKKIFPELPDTDQFRFAIDENILGLIIISAKLHGTSGRSMYQQINKEVELKTYQKLWNIFVDEVFHGPKCLFNFWFKDVDQIQKLKFYPSKKEWTHLYGSRRVVKGSFKLE